MAKGRLTPEDWTMAALRAMARGGVAGVSVNALATELDATRGSFYWHFKDRDALLSAALELWAREATTAVIHDVRRVEDPRQRLKALFTTALGEDVIEGLEPVIVAHAAHPAVEPVLRRMTEERLTFLAELYADLGFAPAPARRQAVLAYAAYLGWIELRRSAPEVVPEATASSPSSPSALAHLITQLTPSSKGTGHS